MCAIDAASIMHLAVDGHFAGILAVTDSIKESTHEAIQTLHDSGLRIIMTTGDGLTTARAVGARLRIDEVHGEVKPADKLALVEKLQKEGHVVAMAGAGGRGILSSGRTGRDRRELLLSTCFCNNALASAAMADTCWVTVNDAC